LENKAVGIQSFSFVIRKKNSKGKDQMTHYHKAESLINKYMFSSIAVGLVPIPLVDLIALSGLQLSMLRSLAKLYGIPFSKERGKALITALLGGSVPLSFSRQLVSLVKSMPVYGQVTGMLSISIFGGASTYAIGKVFMQHFESGGTFLTFEPQKVSDYYTQQFEKAQQELKNNNIGRRP